MSVFTSAQKWVGAPLRSLFGIRREGMENTELKPPFVLCSNHRSNFDPIILGAALPFDLKFMAKEELFRVPVLRGIVRAFGAFPVSRGRHDSAALGKATGVLKSGQVLAMFPEGHRQKKNGPLQPFKSGAVLFAAQAGVPILPVMILAHGHVRPFGRSVVRVGRPVTAAELGIAEISGESLRAAREILRTRMAALADSAAW